MTPGDGHLGALYRAERQERQRLDTLIEVALCMTTLEQARVILQSAVRDYDPSNRVTEAAMTAPARGES